MTSISDWILNMLMCSFCGGSLSEMDRRALISSNCDHLMIHSSLGKLVTGNLIADTCLREYGSLIRRRGGAYCLPREGRFARNVNHFSLPEARLAKAGNDTIQDRIDLISSFCEGPDTYGFLKAV
jgi:hypothetical protein